MQKKSLDKQFDRKALGLQDRLAGALGGFFDGHCTIGDAHRGRCVDHWAGLGP